MSLIYVTFEQLPGIHHAALFLVDSHLNNPPNFAHTLLPEFRNQETLILFAPNGIAAKRFKHCWYKVGGFTDIRVVWPTGWPAPRANTYGWLPKLEFGNPNEGPYYNGVNPALVNPVQPFTYVDFNGNQITPLQAG